MGNSCGKPPWCPPLCFQPGALEILRVPWVPLWGTPTVPTQQCHNRPCFLFVVDAVSAARTKHGRQPRFTLGKSPRGVLPARGPLFPTALTRCSEALYLPQCQHNALKTADLACMRCFLSTQNTEVIPHATLPERTPPHPHPPPHPATPPTPAHTHTHRARTRGSVWPSHLLLLRFPSHTTRQTPPTPHETPQPAFHVARSLSVF